MTGCSKYYEATAASFRAAIARGETRADVVRTLASIYNVEPATIRQRLRKAGLWEVEPNKGKPKPERRMSEGARRPAEVLPDPVFRDPCPRCNVRADIGCRHTISPFGPQRLVAGRLSIS